jgi:mRNA interferase RelE/StbE
VRIRVEILDEVLGDLEATRKSGRLKDFLAKLVRLEDEGADVGLPLGHRAERRLVGWNKIVVGDRNWRIVFRMKDDTTAVVGIIGDRDDDQCYRDLAHRVGPENRLGQTLSLAAALAQMMQATKTQKKRRSGRV